MTVDELAARLDRIEAVLGRLERFIGVAIEAAPFWLRAKIKGAMSNDASQQQRDTADRPAA